MSTIRYSPASIADLEEISKFLSTFSLPAADISTHLSNFILAKDSQQLVGCIGLEVYGAHALLRSLAVHTSFRNRKIAHQLCEQIIRLAASRNVTKLHLLTETAQKYFEDLGFDWTQRSEAPERIQRTIEFAELCPASAVYMTKKI